MKSGVYMASKTQHAEKWRRLRECGEPIISTWIDEAGVGESASMADLWVRCVREPASAAAVVVYHESGDVLKGAYVEVGAALASNVPVFVVGDPPGSWTAHPLVTRCTSLLDALNRATCLHVTALNTASASDIDDDDDGCFIEPDGSCSSAGPCRHSLRAAP